MFPVSIPLPSKIALISSSEKVSLSMRKFLRSSGLGKEWGDAGSVKFTNYKSYHYKMLYL